MTKIVKILLYASMLSSCASSSTSDPRRAPAPERGDTATDNSRQPCERIAWSIWAQAVTSTPHYVLVHHHDLLHVSTDGETEWRWPLRRPPDSEGPAPHVALARTVHAADTLTIRDGRVTFLASIYLALLEAETGHEIHVDRGFRDPVWEREVVVRGKSRLSADEESVSVTSPSGDREFEGGELYTCGEETQTFVVTSDGRILGVDEAGQIELARTTSGNVLGYYADGDGEIRPIRLTDDVVADDQSCWNIGERPEIVRANIWDDFHATKATTTQDGHAVLRSRISNPEAGTGVLHFLPFDEPRDVLPCRRVTRKLQIPVELD